MINQLNSNSVLHCGNCIIVLLLACTISYAGGDKLLHHEVPASTRVSEKQPSAGNNAYSSQNAHGTYTVKLNPSTLIKVKTYTKTTALGQAIRDVVFRASDVLVTVSGLPEKDVSWSLADISGTKNAKGGVFKITKGDLEYIEPEEGDKLIIKTGGQETTIATYTPQEIWTWQDLQAMRQYLGGTYTLMRNIVFPDKDNNGMGDYNFTPVGSNITGTNATRFTGVLNGNGYTIDKLYINHGALDYVGLFGYMSGKASVHAAKLLHVVISGNSYVGSLTGHSDGIVEHGYALARVTGIGNFIGGLIGYNSGFVEGYTRGQVIGSQAIGGLVGGNNGLALGYTLASVRGIKGVGGFVGENSGSVSGYAKNDVLGGNNTGGLIGENIGLIDGYATGDVVGKNNTGGLVGLNAGQVTGYAMGQVTGNAAGIGGLVGYSLSTGFVMGYTHGRVSGVDQGIGGLVGINEGEVVGYATGVVRGGFDVGGLVGLNKGNVIGYATGTVMGSGDVGGFAGTTFGTLVGYATGHVADGVYVGGFVGSDFSSSKTVGYWDIKATARHSSAGGKQVVGVNDLGDVPLRSASIVNKAKYKSGAMPISAHPLFIRFFEPSTPKSGWPKLKKKIVVGGKSYNFTYPQPP